MAKIFIKDGTISSSATVSHDIDNTTVVKVSPNKLEVTGSADISTDLVVRENSYLYEKVGAESYMSGFTGYGWRFDPNFG